MWNKSKPETKPEAVQIPVRKRSIVYRAFWWSTKHACAFSGGVIACVLAVHWTFVGINLGSAEFVQRVTQPANHMLIDTLSKAAGMIGVQEAHAAIPEVIKTPEELKEWQRNLLSRENELAAVTALYTEAMDINRKCIEIPAFKAKHQDVCAGLSDAEMKAMVMK